MLNARAADTYTYANVVDVEYGTADGQAGWAATGGNNYNNRTLSELGITGVPFNTTTFKPTNSALKVQIYNFGSGYPATDFYGEPRGTWPQIVGAVNY